MKIIDGSVEAVEWPTPADRSTTPLATSEEESELMRFCNEHGFRWYWYNRADDYVWALRWLSTWAKNHDHIKLMDVGCGASPWIAWAASRIDGLVATGSDIAGPGTYGESFTEMLRSTPKFGETYINEGVPRPPSAAQFNVISSISAVEH